MHVSLLMPESCVLVSPVPSLPPKLSCWPSSLQSSTRICPQPSCHEPGEAEQHFPSLGRLSAAGAGDTVVRPETPVVGGFLSRHPVLVLSRETLLQQSARAVGAHSHLLL